MRPAVTLFVQNWLPLFLAALSGLAGGVVAVAIGAPMPFLIGGVFGAAFFVIRHERTGRQMRNPPPLIRLPAIAATGAMIGCNVTPGVLALFPLFWPSALAVVPFILIAHSGGYFIFYKLGGYRPVDAFFASIPGGLIEAVLLGEKAGADVTLLTVHHFIRVIAIVITVPLLFLAFTGEVVGTAAGAAQTAPSYGLMDIPTIAAVAFAGIWLGRLLAIPAPHLLGPLTLAMALSIAGVITVAVPLWLLQMAQYAIGVTLGLQFSGLNSALLLRGLKLGGLAVSYMLGVGFAFALLLRPFVPADVAALFISFAAGGVTEMSLIALSLNLSPVIVAMHHLIRIFLAIWISVRLEPYLIRDDRPR
jgi:membrane AbrB-like protein